MSKNQSIKAKSLYELGIEYEKHIEIQQSFIDNCKAAIKRASALGDNDAVAELRKNLKVFHEIKNELEDTAKTLKNYYKGDFHGK